MIKILKTELYEFRHDFICLCMIAIPLFYGMFSGSGYMENNYFNLKQGGYEVLMAMLYDAPGTCLLISAFPALLIGKSFSNRTIGPKITAGNSRSNVFFSKVVSILSISVIATIIYSISGAAAVTLKYGWNAPAFGSIFTLIKIMVCTILLYSVIFSIIIFWAVIFKDTIRTIIASVITIFINAIYIAYGRGWKLPISMHPMIVLRRILQSNSLVQFVGFSLYAAILLSVILILSYAIFRRCELK